MEKITIKITELLLNKKYIKKEEFDIYQYGINVFLEVCISLIASIIICFWLEMPLEGILFFLCFIPLRSFFGGIHMKNFSLCFIFSCISLTVILILTRVAVPQNFISIIMILVSDIYIIYVANKENGLNNQYFLPQINMCMLIINIISLFFIMFSFDSYLFLVACTCILVSVSKFIERRK